MLVKLTGLDIQQSLHGVKISAPTTVSSRYHYLGFTSDSLLMRGDAAVLHESGRRSSSLLPLAHGFLSGCFFFDSGIGRWTGGA